MARLQISLIISLLVTVTKRQVWLLQADGARRAASIIEIRSFSFTGPESKDLVDLRLLSIRSNSMIGINLALYKNEPDEAFR
jgi:hypothetical protein